MPSSSHVLKSPAICKSLSASKLEWHEEQAVKSKYIHKATSAQLWKGSHGSKKRSLFRMARPLTKSRTACRKTIGSVCVSEPSCLCFVQQQIYDRTLHVQAKPVHNESE